MLLRRRRLTCSRIGQAVILTTDSGQSRIPSIIIMWMVKDTFVVLIRVRQMCVIGDRSWVEVVVVLLLLCVNS